MKIKIYMRTMNVVHCIYLNDQRHNNIMVNKVKVDYDIFRFKFKLFDMNRDGPGVSKDEKPFVPNLVSMPKFYFRNFSRVLSLNFLFIILKMIDSMK